MQGPFGNGPYKWNKSMGKFLQYLLTLHSEGHILQVILTCILETLKSLTGGLNTDTQESMGSGYDGKMFSLAVLGWYWSISHKVSTSLNFGVSPALTTLSLQAMHSIQSGKK